MDLYKNEVLEIFKRNFNFEIVETIMGTAVKMDPINAFLFANITGSGYFDNPTFLFSPKGTQKVLREAFQYNLVTGIYNGASLYYSPAELYKKRPYLFQSDKYILFEEIDNEYLFTEKLEDLFDYIRAQGYQPTDFIISRIETNKNGNGMEPFMEYLACEYFKQYGYIVENQVPLTATVGSPDFAAYKIDGDYSGFHINELSLIRFSKDIEKAHAAKILSAIVGEAKTSTKIMENQLKKYLNTNLFTEGYEIHPDKTQPGSQSFGLLNINSSYAINCKQPSTPYITNSTFSHSLQEYTEWVNSYLKFFLMANFTQAELTTIIQDRTNKINYNIEDLISFINRISIEEIISKIQEVI